MISVLGKFVSQSGYDIPHSELDLQHLSHPDYSSIKSITDTLDHFGIECIAAVAPKEALEEMPVSFLAFMETTESNSYGLVRKKYNRVTIDLEDRTTRKLTTEEFLKIWSGHFIAIEPSVTPAGTRKVEVLFYASVILLGIMQYQLSSVYSLISVILSGIGLYLSFSVSRQELGIKNTAVSAVCGAFQTHADCSKVISSSQGKIFGGISLGDVSMAYFAALLSFHSLFPYGSSLVLITALLSTPVLAYSIYQQAFVLKQWCAICLLIISVMVLQFALAATVFTGFSSDWSEVLILAFFFLATITAWKEVKRGLDNEIQLTSTTIDFQRFKRNRRLFDTMLHERQLKNDINSLHHPITFGAASPVVDIIGITNPYCGYCVESMKVYHKILATYKDKVRVSLVFNVPVNTPENPATRVASEITRLYHSGDRGKTWEVIQQWYANKNFDAWIEGLPSSFTTSGYQVPGDLADHRDWSISNKLNYTPVTIINNNIFPHEYGISDLPVLLEEMITRGEEVSQEMMYEQT